MSLEQFFLPPQEWCESKINENSRFFHLFSQKTVGSLNKIVYGLNYKRLKILFVEIQFATFSV